MTLFKVTTPTPEFTGVVAGVAFAKSEATVDDGMPAGRKALAYFRRKDYRVEPVTTLEPVPVAAEQVEPEQVEPPARGATKDAWVAFVTSEAAGEKRLTLEDASAFKRDELAELILGPKED